MFKQPQVPSSVCIYAWFSWIDTVTQLHCSHACPIYVCLCVCVCLLTHLLLFFEASPEGSFPHHPCRPPTLINYKLAAVRAIHLRLLKILSNNEKCYFFASFIK